MLFQWTDHSRRQAARRGLSQDELEYVLFHASHYHRAGAIIYYLREVDLPIATATRRMPAGWSVQPWSWPATGAPSSPSGATGRVG